MSYKELLNGGSFNTPFLIKFIQNTQQGPITQCYINDNKDLVYNGDTYHASTFNYELPKNKNGVLQAGSIDIVALKEVVDLAEFIDTTFRVEVIGILRRDGQVTPHKFFQHRYGTLTIENDYRVKFTFTNDNRMSVTFPPYVFDSDNNRGNA